MNTFNHSRIIESNSKYVFSAISDPERLKKWWGPAGFTNTFEVCDFKAGGKWIYTMHGPDGKNYANECIFTEIETNQKVVIQHDSLPKYKLKIVLTPCGQDTLVHWSQTFEKSEVSKAIAHIVNPANEQNLDRLVVEVLNEKR